MGQFYVFRGPIELFISVLTAIKRIILFLLTHLLVILKNIANAHTKMAYECFSYRRWWLWATNCHRNQITRTVNKIDRILLNGNQLDKQIRKITNRAPFNINNLSIEGKSPCTICLHFCCCVYSFCCWTECNWLYSNKCIVSMSSVSYLHLVICFMHFDVLYTCIHEALFVCSQFCRWSVSVIIRKFCDLSKNWILLQHLMWHTICVFTVQSN